jgi:hypothetical protein
MTALEVLRKDLEESISSRVDAIAYGVVENYCDYRYLKGVITGLTSALERVKDLQRYEEDEE